jgi:hypothetical protein
LHLLAPGRFGITPAGPPIAIYHDKEFKESEVEVDVADPSSEIYLSDPESGEDPSNYMLYDGGAVPGYEEVR